MNIRKALLSDIPMIQEIAEKAWRPTYGQILSEQQTLYMLDLMYHTNTLSNQINGQISYFMIDDGKDIMGYFALEAQDENIVKLHKLYLDPSKKRMGLGALVIKYIKEWTKNQGRCCIELSVNKNNSAIEFYKKMGFFIIKELILDIGEGYVMDDYVMQLNLGSAQSNA
jgi:GNAT superfamily N-acetyltransferase